MKQPKKVMLASLAVATLAGGALLTSAAYAQSGSDGTGLADAIATKFNLKSDDVQKVITDYRDQHMQEREAEMKTRMTERLDQAVTDGKITEDQKTQILSKMDEVTSRMDEIRSMTDKTERRNAMKQLHDDMQTWAQENNIPTDLMGPAGGPRGMRGHGPWGGGSNGSPSSTDDSATPPDAPPTDDTQVN